MKKSDTTRILELLTDLSESINGPNPEDPRRRARKPLSDRVDELDEKVGKLDDRVSEVQLGLATLTVSTTAQFKKIDERFARIDERFSRIDERFARIDERFDSVDAQFRGVRGAIESTRVQLVDLVSRVHTELTGRIIDLEVPGPGRRGGGGQGPGGVPLAS